MIPAKAVVINHRVYHSGVSASPRRKGFLITDRLLERSIDYASRQGRFDGREGLDKEPTADDLSLARLRDVISYQGRTGRFAGRYEELPVKPGEASGGCFGPNGVIDEKALAEEIKSSGSNLVTSIVSIPREHAGTLGIATKLDFQRLLRATWQEHVEAWGTIAPQDVRWAAFYHTDNKVNVHVHVLTWDRTGAFCGERGIPHARIAPSNAIVRKEAFGRLVLEKNAAKHYLRELGLARMRALVKGALPGAEAARLETLRDGTPFQHHPVPLLPPKEACTDRAVAEARSLLIGSLPETGRGYIQAGSISKDSRKMLDALYGRMREADPGLRRIEALYREQLCQGAAVKGLSKGKAEAFVTDGMKDLRQRLENVVMKDIGNEGRMRNGAAGGVWTDRAEWEPQRKAAVEAWRASEARRPKGRQDEDKASYAGGLKADMLWRRMGACLTSSQQKGLQKALGALREAASGTRAVDARRLGPDAQRALRTARGILLGSEQVMRETARLAALKAGRYAMPYREAYESAVMEKSAMADRLILGSVYGTPAAVQAGRWSSLSTLSLSVMQGLTDGRGGEDEEQQRRTMRPRLPLSRRDDERQGPTRGRSSS